MNDHEDKMVDTFVLKEKRDRYRILLGSPKKRMTLLDRLNHTPDLEPRLMRLLPSSTSVPVELRRLGSPTEVYLISATRRLDGKMLPLEDAIRQIEENGSGTVVSCIPGRLGYYYGEQGECRAVLERKG